MSVAEHPIPQGARGRASARRTQQAGCRETGGQHSADISPRHDLVPFGGRKHFDLFIQSTFAQSVKGQPQSVAHLVEFSLYNDRGGYCAWAAWSLAAGPTWHSRNDT